MTRTTIVLLFAFVGARPVHAGVADTPLPLLEGQKSVHVFTVPGVTHVNGLGTVFVCASTEKTKRVTFGIEIFDFDGRLLNAVDFAAWTIAPGTTFTVETITNVDGGVAAFAEDARTVLSDSANHATARIVATSRNLACSALLASLAGQPPTALASLSVVAQLKQKGD